MVRDIKKYEIEEMEEVFEGYGFCDVVECNRYGEGHINDTFKLIAKEDGVEKSYILQRINTNIFKKPDEVMENIVNVTKYLREIVFEKGGDEQREVLNVINTKNGECFFTDSASGAWRVYIFINNTITLNKVESEQDFANCAIGFGTFFKQLQAFKADRLHETIQKFHDTRDRFTNFLCALKEDRFGRAIDVQAEIAFVKARGKDCCYIMDKVECGELPLRVTHNDTKLNNILLDDKTKECLCIIDLDTIMPGSILNDFGDSIRSGATTALEDETDLSKVNFSLNLYKLYAENYLKSCGNALTAEERNSLRWGAKLMTFECGMRFLTDHLNGDTYFKIHRKNHNLDRARNQFKLVSDMEKMWEAMLI